MSVSPNVSQQNSESASNKTVLESFPLPSEIILEGEVSEFSDFEKLNREKCVGREKAWGVSSSEKKVKICCNDAERWRNVLCSVLYLKKIDIAGREMGDEMVWHLSKKKKGKHHDGINSQLKWQKTELSLSLSPDHRALLSLLRRRKKNIERAREMEEGKEKEEEGFLPFYFLPNTFSSLQVLPNDLHSSTLK